MQALQKTSQITLYKSLARSTVKNQAIPRDFIVKHRPVNRNSFVGMQSRVNKTRASSSSFDANPSSVDGKKDLHSTTGGRHALLHDFCMCIPYGFFIGLGGFISLFMGGGNTGLIVLGAGIAEIVLSNLSLKSWKVGRSSALFTLLQAAVAGGVSWISWQLWQQKVTSRIASGGLLGLSAVAALFFVYNVLAGGNPPRRGDAEEDGHHQE